MPQTAHFLSYLGLRMGIRNIAALAAGAALTPGFAGTASADLITGTFTGTIFNSEDGQNTFGAGIGLGTVNGQSVTGTFSYMFDHVPSNQCDSGFGCYFDTDGVNWLNMSVTINGVTLTIATVDTHFQAVYNHDKSVAGYDYFAVYEQDSKSIFDPVASIEEFRDNQLYVAFSDYLTEFASGSDVPATNFVWPGAGGNDGADGYFNFSHYIYEYETDTFLLNQYANAAWSLDSLTLRVEQIAEVPEPSTLALFSAGLAGLGLMARRKKTAA